MRTLLFIIVSLLLFITANAKPHCQGFNNYDDKVTIVFTDENVRKDYKVSDVVLIPSWGSKEYKATSVSVSVENGIATVTLTFPHVTQFFNPKVELRINGKKAKLRICR